MTPMIWVIWRDDCSIAPIALTARRMTSPLFSASACAAPATARAWSVLSAVERTIEVTSPSAAEASSRLAACCSVRRDRSSVAVAIWLVPARMAPPRSATLAIAVSS